jgi:hypothetical protein
MNAISMLTLIPVACLEDPPDGLAELCGELMADHGGRL